jgi:hypothetical protein
MLAESARRAGLRPIALDLFGDVDTRRAGHWICIANPLRTGIDAKRVHAALARLARHPGVLGWVAGGGFEDQLELLQDCAQTLALIGNDAATIAAAKQPGDFFAMLDDYGIGHPETRLTPPAANAGWLRKRVGATGGWHVLRLQSAGGRADRAGEPEVTELRVTEPPVTRLQTRSQVHYYQREAAGVPMSALFLANGVEVSLIGFNRLLVAAIGDRPFVFHGAVGPVTLPEPAVHAVRHALERITRHIGLRGLNSMDFMLADDRVSVIEINPRPSATMDLHDARLRGGLLNAHLAACRQRSLPPQAPMQPSPVKGLRIVYARRPLLATLTGRSRLQALGWCHDIGPEGTRTGCDEPLCSVSAQAGCAADVIAQLARRARDVQRIHEVENGS